MRSDSLESWKNMEKENTVSVSSNATGMSLEGEWPTAPQRAAIVELVKKAHTPVLVDPSVMQMIVDRCV